MVIGKAGSTDTKLAVNGSMTVGETGTSGTTLTSNAAIKANSTLDVTGNAIFSKNVTVADSIILNGVTIKWDSTLGALTFSR